MTYQKFYHINTYLNFLDLTDLLLIPLNAISYNEIDEDHNFNLHKIPFIPHFKV